MQALLVGLAVCVTAAGGLAARADEGAGRTHAAYVGAVPLSAAGVPSAVPRPPVSAPGLDPAVLDLALGSLACARQSGTAGEPAANVFSVIDFSLPSTARRLWVIDLDTGATLRTERVAHGRNTGEDDAVAFSNIPGSNQSSLGLYRTAEVYVGKHGRSLKLDGLEPGFNDRARDRAIVVHGASYCTGEHVARWGRLGRSQGCPALDPAISDAVIDTIRDGTLVFAYYPDPTWLSGSSFLHCDANMATTNG
ncbi:MAG: murein L,D-transpeptidase catalytic domain family protein [Pseudomonadota bacterium]|nr:murein L,D-transpeptidase catalytic domain family protein [Pseudomonadota bacterium]